MSDKTHADIDAAIAAHVADTFPGYYTSGWILVSASAHLERPNAVNYRLVTSEGQPLHVDAGLLDVGKKIIKDSWDYNDAEEDDDD